MKSRMLIGVAVVLLSACSKGEPAPQGGIRAAATPAAPVVVADSAIQTPESVLYDPIADVYLVSNINGSPLAKDDNGYISRVSPDGQILTAKWIDGAAKNVTLNAPKGTGFSGDTLFVSDIDAVRLFNRNTGAPIATWPVPGATFLNDIAIGPDGTVYVTDSGLKMGADGNFAPTGTDAVYRFDAKGKPVAIAKNKSLEAPNGLIADSGSVTVVAFGSAAVYRLDVKTGARTDLPKAPKGSLDGIVRLADGSLLVTSWAGNAIYRLARGDSAYTTAVDTAVSPADIGYDTKRGRVLIPDFTENKLTFREIK